MLASLLPGSTSSKSRLRLGKGVNPSSIRSAPGQHRCEELSLRLDAYTFRQRLGKGSFGQVYLAETQGLGHGRDDRRLVAVKVVRRTLLEKESTRALALAEAENLRRVSATGSLFFTQLRETFCDAHNLYIVTDYLCGGTLNEELDRLHRVGRVMSHDRIVLVIAQLVEALSQLHDLRIIHRDIKPDNVLLDARGNVVLADFGLSRWFEAGPEGESGTRNALDLTCDSKLSIFKRRRDSTSSVKEDKKLEEDSASTTAVKSCCMTDTGCGTFEYAAPEMHRAEPYSFPADVYSVGVIFHELLFGRLPPFPPTAPLSNEQSETNPHWFIRPNKTIAVGTNSSSVAAFDLLISLLDLDPAKRITLASLRTHPFLSSVHWPTLAQRAYTLPLSHAPPTRPRNLTRMVNTGHFIDPTALPMDGPQGLLEVAYDGGVSNLKLARRPGDPRGWLSKAKESVRMAYGSAQNAADVALSRRGRVRRREWARGVSLEQDGYERLLRIINSGPKAGSTVTLPKASEAGEKVDVRVTVEQEKRQCDGLSIAVETGHSSHDTPRIEPCRTLRRVTSRIHSIPRTESPVPAPLREKAPVLERGSTTDDYTSTSTSTTSTGSLDSECSDYLNLESGPLSISITTASEPSTPNRPRSHPRPRLRPNLPRLTTALPPSSPPDSSSESPSPFTVPHFPWDTCIPSPDLLPHTQEVSISISTNVQACCPSLMSMSSQRTSSASLSMSESSTQGPVTPERGNSCAHTPEEEKGENSGLEEERRKRREVDRDDWLFVREEQIEIIESSDSE